MSIEAHKCNVANCKGFVVFENAEFDYKDMYFNKTAGCYAFANPTCSECGKEFLVVPHRIVIDIKDLKTSDYEELLPVSITAWESREKERNYESETNSHLKILLFLALRNYTYSVSDVLTEYLKHQEQNGYLSHSMEDCFNNLEVEIKKLIEDGEAAAH
ncbi:hypothetical protein ACFYU8_18680 [Brevibacillus sp. NPDC003359]|uniref:hypothetical protein n=1 Tax=unclassified Brevibacillus TaxID=2684853 RepID=UPI0036CE49E3